MKHIFIYLSLLIAVALSSCQKEDNLGNKIDFSNIYAIEDSDDPVQHLRYQIFTDYGVSIYFNDTIGKYYVRDDVDGNPYYRYETIDPDWSFYTNSGDDVSGSDYTYRYYYVEGEDRQLLCLERVRDFLESMVEAMYPTMIMVADSVELLNSAGQRVNSYGTITYEDNLRIVSNIYYTNFRCLMLTHFADYEDEDMGDVYLNLQRILVSLKIFNYEDKLEEFHSISDATADYALNVTTQYPSTEPLYGYYSATTFYYARPISFFDADYRETVRLRWLDLLNVVLSDEDLDYYVESSRTAYAAIVGPHGFVAPSGVSGSAIFVLPANNDTGHSTDVAYYTQMVLQYSQEEFMQYWGGYPKVVQKYNIIRDIIVNDMGVELE